MATGITMEIIARIQSDFTEKFGIPRQSGLVDSVQAAVVFEPEYRKPEALRGIESYSHLWLLWEFSENKRKKWFPTVRPPRLGGNTRMGVFATRSPFRPNAIGLSSVQLVRVNWNTPQGPVLIVSGADLMNDTPIYDIKPYLSFTDSHPNASDGFAGEVKKYALEVYFPKPLLLRVPEDYRSPLCELLAQDPRPSYQQDPQRIYGMKYGKINLRFWVKGGVLTVCDVQGMEDRK